MFRISRHGRLRARLSAFIDGELSARESVDVATHVETCGSCPRELEELRAASELLSSLPEAEPRRSFTLTPRMVAAPAASVRQGGAPRVAMGMRMAAAGLAATLAVLFVVDTGDLGSDGGGREKSADESANLQAQADSGYLPSEDPALEGADGAAEATAAAAPSGDITLNDSSDPAGDVVPSTGGEDGSLPLTGDDSEADVGGALAETAAPPVAENTDRSADEPAATEATQEFTSEDSDGDELAEGDVAAPVPEAPAPDEGIDILLIAEIVLLAGAAALLAGSFAIVIVKRT